METNEIVDPKIKHVATGAACGSVFGGVTIEFDTPFRPTRRARFWARLAGDRQARGQRVTSYECVGEDAIYAGRVRDDPAVESGLALWAVSDNLRRGAALNAIHIAACLTPKRRCRGGRSSLTFTAIVHR